MGLTRSIGDRIFVGLMGGLFAPLSGSLLYMRMLRGDPAEGQDWLSQMLVFLFLDVAGIVFVGSLLAIFWGLFAPVWLEQRLRRQFSRLGFAISVLGVVIGGMFCWFVLIAP
jgi:hypothetical protein